MGLTILEEEYAVCKMDPSSSIPDIVFKSPFYSISRSEEELSLVCHENFKPKAKETEDGWKVIKVDGPLDFGLTGILYSLSKPLAKNEISLFAISTFNTDYILVKKTHLAKAKMLLTEAGFLFKEKL